MKVLEKTYKNKIFIYIKLNLINRDQENKIFFKYYMIKVIKITFKTID